MIFKKDSALLGLFLGLFIPLVVYLIQIKLIPLIMGQSFSRTSMELFALVFNLPLIRYFLINVKHENTGKGILFATFIYALIWVYTNQL